MGVYKNFKEVEQDIAENTPPIIYKYRDWGKVLHKTIITERELFFSHPHKLNDPQDIRHPYIFNTEFATTEKIRASLISAAARVAPELRGKALDEAVNKRLRDIQLHPERYFQKNLQAYHEDESMYNRTGVLSLCSSFDNNHVWREYGNNHEGFAIGYDTVELARHLNCLLTIVEYDDAPLEFIVLGDNSRLLEKEIGRKTKKWEPEQEIRFFTSGIGINRERVTKFPANVVREIILGVNTSEETQREIIEAVKISMPGVPVYKLSAKSGEYGFDRELIIA